MRNMARLESYISRLEARTRIWEGIALQDGSCVLLDLSFARQWLECGNSAWAWGCAQNARNLARQLGIMRAARA